MEARTQYEKPEIKKVEMRPEESMIFYCKTFSEMMCEKMPTIGS